VYRAQVPSMAAYTQPLCGGQDVAKIGLVPCPGEAQRAGDLEDRPPARPTLSKMTRLIHLALVLLGWLCPVYYMTLPLCVAMRRRGGVSSSHLPAPVTENGTSSVGISACIRSGATEEEEGEEALRRYCSSPGIQSYAPTKETLAIEAVRYFEPTRLSVCLSLMEQEPFFFTCVGSVGAG